MIVFPRVFLILFIPFLVQGIDSENTDPNTASNPINPLPQQNHGHSSDDTHSQVTLPSMGSLELHTADRRLRPVLLFEAGSKYGLRGGSIDTVIPTHDYFRVPLWLKTVIVIEPNGNLRDLEPNQVVRSKNANIPKSRLDEIIFAPRLDDIHVPMLHIHPTPGNDQLIKAIPLPPGSGCYYHGRRSSLPEDEYFLVPPTAVIDIPWPIYGINFGGQIVRIMNIDNIQFILNHYLDMCNDSYVTNLKQIQKQTTWRIYYDTFVRSCMNNMWNKVVEAGEAITFSPLNY